MEMNIVFRKSELKDIDQMVRIAEEGKALLRSKGINQWQRGTYPDRNWMEQNMRPFTAVQLPVNTRAGICPENYLQQWKTWPGRRELRVSA